MVRMWEVSRQSKWPLGIAGIVTAFFVADGTLITVAFLDRSVGPEPQYYDTALRHDAVVENLRRARRVGMRAAVTVADAPIADMPRRVDLRVTDGRGQPVSGLGGSLTAIRPSDVRLRNQAALIGVPEEQGTYRLLLRIPVSGLWEFVLDAQKGGQEYRVVVRQDVAI